jgi:Peptidase family M28
MKQLPRAALFLLLLACPGFASAQDKPSPTAVPDAVKGISARELGGHMRFLASDLMRGRDTASNEIRLAAEYISSRLYAAGAEPAGEVVDGKKTYFQLFPLETVTPQLDGTSVSLILEQNGSKRVVPCQIGVDVFLQPRGITSGEEVDAPVVFAGYGLVNEAEKVDDYAGLDVKGRFVLAIEGIPPRKDEPKADDAAKAVPKANARGRGGRAGNANAFAKREEALKRGAVGLLLIRQPLPDPNAADIRSTLQNRGGFGRGAMTLGHAPTSIPILSFADPIRQLIFKATDLTIESKPKALDGVRVKFTLAAKKEMKEDRNVVGLFPGSDPARAKEVIIFSAHYDHVGVDEKGEIFNGSDDNASGTSALLEIAEAFGDGPRPARSIAFLWVSGEEKGLLGSQWFSDHISLPAGYKIVADINLDMVSRNDAKTIGITPSDKHADYSTLIPAAQAACKEEGMTPLFNADEFYFRTDSYNFARKGIPVIFFFCGVHEDYHKPTDDFTKADFEKAARVSRAAYRLGWQMAQEKEAPHKIKPAEAKTADARP